MALKRLTTAEMVQISGPWTTNGSAAREAIQSIPELAGILPRMDAAHKQLHAARPAQDDPRAAELAREAAEIDARHDAVVRGVDRVLEGLLLLAGDSARARAIEAARGVLTPDGVTVISTTYRNEAGAAALLASRLAGEAGVKALLASIAIDDKMTLTAFVNERIQLGAKLGQLEDERAKLLAGPAESDGAANVEARNAWIRAGNALVANAALAELSQEQSAAIFSALHQAEARADRRGKAAPAEPTPGPADPVLSDCSARAAASPGAGAPASPPT